MKLRLIDFRWYYNAVGLLDSYRAYSIAFSVAAWFSRTFNVALLTQMTEQKHKII